MADKKSRVVSTRFVAGDADVLDELRRRAQAGDRSLSRQIVRTLRTGLAVDVRARRDDEFDPTTAQLGA